MTTENFTLQVLICTHDRVDLLKRALEYINQAIQPDNCDISLCVVANACSDNTLSFLQDYQQSAANKSHFPLNWLDQPQAGKSFALNLAIPKLTADFIAMVDDDHRVDKNYFVSIKNAVFNFPDADFFCGKIIPDWDGSEPHWVHDKDKYRIYPLPVPRFELGEKPKTVNKDIAVPGGGNLVIKRTLFKKTGDFSTDLGPVGHNLGGGEDYQWVVRAYNIGAKLWYIPDIVQFHYVDTQRLTLRYIIKKAFERSASVVAVNEAAQNYSGFLFPRYLLKKSCSYLFQCIFCFSNAARRFYLVRLAASLGEINGFFTAKKTNI